MLLQLSLAAVNPAHTLSFVLHSYAGTVLFNHHKVTVKTMVCCKVFVVTRDLFKEQWLFHTALAHFLSISGSFRLESTVLKNNIVLGSFQFIALEVDKKD